MRPMSDTPFINRLLLVNGIRLALGAFFFVYLAALSLLKLYFSPGAEAVIFLGLYLFSYSLLTQYYLKTQKAIARTEGIFLSVFITLLDILLITASAYFTGSGESPFSVFYLLSLLATSFIFPYYLPGMLIWPAVVTIFYEGMLFLTRAGLLPAFPRFWSEQYSAAAGQITLVNALGIPLILFAVSLVAYFISGYPAQKGKKWS